MERADYREKRGMLNCRRPACGLAALCEDSRMHGKVLVLLCIFTSCGGCADHILLHPSTQPANTDGAIRRTIEDRGKTIEIFTAQSRGARASGRVRAFVLEFCGNATRAEYITQYLADRWGDRPV